MKIYIVINLRTGGISEVFDHRIVAQQHADKCTDKYDTTFSVLTKELIES